MKAFSGCLLPIVAPPSFGKNDLSGMCISTAAKVLTWTLYWYGIQIDYLIMTIKGVNGGEPLSLPFLPDGPGFVGPLGNWEPGADQIQSVTGVLPDDTQIDLTPLITAFLGTDTLNIPTSGKFKIGSICQ